MKEALKILPPDYQRAAGNLDRKILSELEELRLRQDAPPSMVVRGRERPFPLGRAVAREDLERTVQAAASYSLYQATTLKDGFLTLPGGHRLGICGTAVMQSGEVAAVRSVSSVNLRIARQLAGIGESVFRQLGGLRESTLIIGPPGSGKTTLLRDLIRLAGERQGLRFGVADERGEIGGAGPAHFFLGPCCDVMTGAPKAQGIAMLLGSMSPQWIAVDEITRQEDGQALLQAGYCGVSFLAAAHAFSREELVRRPVYRRLTESGLFRTLLVLDREKTPRIERMPVL